MDDLVMISIKLMDDKEIKLTIAEARILRERLNEMFEQFGYGRELCQMKENL